LATDEAILDGRNRYRACLAAGVGPVFRPFTGDDPIRFVLAANIHRRHLTESQRAMIAAQIATRQHGGDRKSDQAATLPVDIPTQTEAAEMLNVSERSVRTARKVLEQAEPADVKAITEGKATVSGIAKKLKAAEEKKQRRAARESELAAKQHALPNKKYGVIYADPEWRFEPYSRETGLDRAADIPDWAIEDHLQFARRIMIVASCHLASPLPAAPTRCRRIHYRPPAAGRVATSQYWKHSARPGRLFYRRGPPTICTH
jgi:hypothetical protein